MIKNLIIFSSLAFLVFSCKEQETEQPATTVDTTISKVPEGTIQVHGQALTVDAKTGGRIESLTIDGKNFLTGQDVNADNWGSTFWTSPQASWGWPPIAEIDNLPYQATYEENLIKMTSEEDKKMGFVIEKSITGNNADTSFTITYSIINQSGGEKNVAPWEITRVFPGGITFYPTGEGEKRGDLAALTKDSLGITWFDYSAVTIPGGVPKLLADGAEGWMAQVNDGYILVKKWDDVPLDKNAPDEGEIELYTNPDKSYIEIEQQGAYELLPVGKSSSWEVTWYLRKLPEYVDAKAGSQSLLDYARSLVK